MAEHLFIKKRQRQRGKSLFTTKNALRLVLVSLLTWGGFLYFVGDPTIGTCVDACESEHSLGIWILGFFMIFAGVILFASIIGGIFAFLRWQRGGNENSFSSLMENNPDKEA